jgi:hypothetical protein
MDDPLGPVSGGYIRIQGPLCSVERVLGSTKNTLQLLLGHTVLQFRELMPDEDILPMSNGGFVQSFLPSWRR